MIIRITFFILIALGSFLWAQEDSAPFKMLESHLITGLIPDIDDAYGVAFRDFNNDGYPDIYLVCFRNLNRLLINNGGIIPFIDRTIHSGLGGYLMTRGESNLELGSCVADYDNDGKPDIFLAGWGKTHKLFRNLGNLVFEDATANLNLQGIVDANQGIWFDANNDGYLDLYLTDEHHTNRFFINNANGFFSEALWTETFIDSAISQGGCAADFNNDGFMDLYIANWRSRDYLLINDGKGLFRRVDLPLPTLQEIYDSNSAAVGDIDNDGDLDLFVATKEGRVFLYRNHSTDQQLQFTYDADHSFFFENEDAYGVLLEDFNNDGWLDCFFSLFGENRLYLNDQTGGFLSDFSSDRRSAQSTGAAAADLDLDGDMDIFVANKDEFSRIYLNPTNNDRFISIRLTGVVSNRDAIGTKVYFYDSEDSLRNLIGFREVSAQCGYLSSSEPTIHFGTGEYRSLDIKIVYPSGKVMEINGLKPGRRYQFAEYNLAISTTIFALNTIRYHISRSEFWINLFLFLIFLMIIWIHVYLGINRFQWQTVGMATQLIIWFTVSAIIFTLFRKTPLETILIALNAVSLFGVLVISGYSEHMRSLRRRRAQYRKQLQAISDQMINIHDNRELFQQLITTIASHDDIKTAFILFNHENSALDLYKPDGEIIPAFYSLSQDVYRKILTRNRIDKDRDHLLPDLFGKLQVNSLLPVKRENALYGMIAIDMKNRDSHVNQEDFQLLQTIANQTAIAIANNNYIEESARLIKKLTEAEIREEYLKQLEKTNRELDQKNAELTRLFKELQEKEAQLIHSEKMASLGQLVAGISHELNNPISFIYANSQSLQDYLKAIEELWASMTSSQKDKREDDFGRIIDELRSIIADNIRGSRSVKELVLDLKNFSRLDQAQWKDAQLVSGIESSLRILQAQMRPDIEIIRDFRADPLLFCNPGQLNQVFINVISNAIQALEGKGTITIRTYVQGDQLNIEFEDSGKGIPKEILPRIFDPFFTTKDVNEGSGLGLSISYSIVKKHNGSLLVDSTPGKGSKFTIVLPLTGRDTIKAVEYPLKNN